MPAAWYVHALDVVLSKCSKVFSEALRSDGCSFFFGSDDVVAALAASVESRTSHTYSKGKWRVINRRHLNSRALLDSLSNAHDILADTGAFKLLEEDDSNLRLMPVFVVSSIVEENLLLDDGLMQAQ